VKAISASAANVHFVGPKREALPLGRYSRYGTVLSALQSLTKPWLSPEADMSQRAGRLGLAGLFGSLRFRGLYGCPVAGSVAMPRTPGD
jgi:hypothetical protein